MQKKNGNTEFQSLSYKTLTTRVEKKFTNTSIQYLFLRLYAEVPVRDDFGHIRLIRGDAARTEAINMSEKFNYIWFSNHNKKAEAIIRVSKTSNGFPLAIYPLSSTLTKLIIHFIDDPANRCTMYLFNYKSMTAMVSKFLREIGIEKKTGINYLRHAIITDFYKKNPSTEDKVRLADKMLHSIDVQATYVRGIIPDDD